MIGLSIGGMNPYLSGGQDIQIWRKPKNAWGETKSTYSGITLERVALMPRTTATAQGEGFQGRVNSGYTMLLDDYQVQLIRQDDEFRLEFPGNLVAFFGLDGWTDGGQYANPLSAWRPGSEVQLKYLRGARTGP